MGLQLHRLKMVIMTKCFDDRPSDVVKKNTGQVHFARLDTSGSSIDLHAICQNKHAGQVLTLALDIGLGISMLDNLVKLCYLGA